MRRSSSVSCSAHKNTRETFKIGLIVQRAHILYILGFHFLTIGYVFNIDTSHSTHDQMVKCIATETYKHFLSPKREVVGSSWETYVSHRESRGDEP